MSKITFIVGRFVFLSVVSIFTVVFLFWELFVLNSGRFGKTIVYGEENIKKVDPQVLGAVSSDDARPVIIKKYLEKYQSPLVPYSDLIFQLSQTYGFDYYWIVAIAQQESNLCKKIPDDSYNCWGYGIHKKGTLRFDSYELSLRSYAEYLKREYFDKGLNTPELMMKKYCPNSNGSWALGVRQFISEMESGNF